MSLVTKNFATEIADEFINGSEIAPSLFNAAVKIVKDTEVLPGGDVAYPIHEALNWNLTRFGQQARASQEAGLLMSESGVCWQAKLSTPSFDKKKGKLRKYEAPVGFGARVYFPPVPPEIRRKISDRYTIPVPDEGSFWQWLEHHPEIPITPTEGAKKGLALLSQGFVPLILYGVNSGYSRNLDDSRELTPDVSRFATTGRRMILAFDRDTKDSTRRKVYVALHRFGGLLTQAGVTVSVALWHPEQGKGVDDLIVRCGVDAWESAYEQALLLKHWQIQQHLERRLSYPVSLKVETVDLSTLQGDIPLTGIVAIASPKGTGKTKFIAQLTSGTEKVLAGGHRIALMRNLSTRLKLDYKGDLDKVNGEFITGSGYTLRIGLCVDSLLSIDPSKFADCDLILDEVVQVIRHLLTSSTCGRDGKRPAILARFRELVRVARRVIVADADLDTATLEYLQALREQATPAFLIKNTFVGEGYSVRYIDAPDRSVIVQDLVERVKTLPATKLLFIATDGKGTSKTIARLLTTQFPDKRVLLVNSETSGGEMEREFIQTPDQVIERGEYDVIICSPSVATGVSIEAQGKIDAVYGIFTGGAGTDGDLAQALGRVREPVERVVWCAKQGGNFSKVSRSTNAKELKQHLLQKTNLTVRLIRSNLREDVIDSWNHYNWHTDPHLDLYARMAAQQNFAMFNLRDALLIRLRMEGNQVQVQHRAADGITKVLLKTARQEQRELDAECLVAVEDLMFAEIQILEQKEGLTPEEAQAVSKFYFKDFYCLDTITTDDVLWDNEGRRRGEILSLEAQLYPYLAIDRTAKTLEKQTVWNQGYCSWDLGNIELKRRVRSLLGIDELVAKIRSGWNWTKYDLAPYALKARAMQGEIKVALNFSINDRMGDVQIIHQLIAQLGIQISQLHWSRSVAGHEGEKLRVYELNSDHWEKVWAILQSRETKRQQRDEEKACTGSPPLFNNQNQGGDPATKGYVDARWLTPESLAEVRGWLAQASRDPIVMDLFRDVPLEVMRLAQQP